MPGPYNGTAAGTLAYAAGATGYGQALSLDGAGTNYVAIAQAATQMAYASGSSCALSARVKIAAGVQTQPIGVFFGNTDVFLAITSAGLPFFGVQNGNLKVTGTASIADGTWHHVYGLISTTGTTTTFALFVDGVQVAASGGVSGYAPTASTSSYIGALSSGTAYQLVGLVDECAAFNPAPYTSAFAPPTVPFANSAAGLLSLYHLDGNLADSTGASVPSAGVPTISAPANLQVIQQNAGTGLGVIAIAGTNTDSATRSFEANWSGNGTAYATIASNVAAGATFTGSLAGQPKGYGTLTVRPVGLPAQAATVASVGIGDVYLWAGQSNATGQAYPSNGTYTTVGPPARFFSYARQWADLVDPTGVTTGNTFDALSNADGAAGSMLPRLATMLMSYLKCPVAFVPASADGTGLVSASGGHLQWLPGGALPSNRTDTTTLYGSLVSRARAANVGAEGYRAILWFQGETDAINAVSTSAYLAGLATLVGGMRSDVAPSATAPPPFLPFVLANSPNAGGSTNLGAIQAAQRQAVGTIAGVKAGPDLSGIPTDGLHIYLTSSLESAADLAFVAILQACYGLGAGLPSIGSRFIH